LGIETDAPPVQPVRQSRKAWKSAGPAIFSSWANLRGFDLNALEGILRNASERYTDAATGRRVAIGKHGNTFVAIPYDQDQDTIVPVTVHATSRQQVTYRLNSGRFVYE
jgi:hypothetical protein